jgi:hypothetical protein
MPESYVTNPCTYYFCNLNQNGEPILGTMKSKHSNQLEPGQTTCTEGRLPNTQFVVPAGHKQCFPKSGLRYFYQVNVNTKQIIPNSLMSRIGKPESMCKGTSSYLEYIIWQ